MYLGKIRQIAEDKTTAPDILAQLAQSPDYYTRKNVAANTNTPTKILLSICREFPDEVMNNPVIPLLILEDPYLLTCKLKLGFPQLEYFIDLEIDRLDWSDRRKKYLKEKYGQSHQDYLTDEQKYDFLCYLKLQ